MIKYTVNKSAYPRGPWDTEPDKHCRMIRSGFSGSWCGYVRVPHGSKLQGAGKLSGRPRKYR